MERNGDLKMPSKTTNSKLKGMIKKSTIGWEHKTMERMEITGLNLVAYKDVMFLMPANYFQLDSLQSVYVEVWMAGMYDVFPVEGEQVVDVGGFMGDTALYFLSRGAKFVNIYEPGESGDYIGINMLLNGIKQEQYNLHLTAVTGENGEIYINSNWNCGSTPFLRNNPPAEGEGRIIVKTVTLADIAVQDAILKFDTEGSEYNTFELADCGAIRKFKAIMMEYHDRGPDIIANKLMECGFEIVKVDPNEGDTGSGMLFAKRIG
jgi:FkbM family methyltransferase